MSEQVKERSADFTEAGGQTGSPKTISFFGKELAKKVSAVRLYRTVYPYLYILPAALVMLMITFYPLLFQSFMSFTNYAPQHLRLKQREAISLIVWDALQSVPSDFKKQYAREYREKYGTKPAVKDIRAAFRKTEVYLTAYEIKMNKMGLKKPLVKILLKNPFVFMGFGNFKNIIYNSDAVTAFKQKTGLSRWKELAGIFKGKLAISKYNFGRVFIFNILWTAVNVIIHVVVGIAIALVLNVNGVRLKGIYRALFILPYAIPSFVTATCWRNMFDSQFGAVNQMIGMFNDGIAALIGADKASFVLIPESLDWINGINPPLGLDIFPLPFYAALISNIWLGWPFMMVIATGALQSIPGNLYEAADVDGANGLQKLFRITIPLLRPAMAPAIMLGVIWTFNNFNIIYIVTEGKPLGGTEIMVTQAYKLIQENRVFGVASAFCIIVFLVLFFINLFLRTVTRASEAAYE